MELCRLTVLSKSVQIDLALPTDIPISLLVPGIVELLGSRTSGDSDSVRSDRSWVLSRVGQPPLPDTATLHDASVHDGELLVLGTADAPAPPPLFDDLMNAVATAGGTRSGLWTARTAQLTGFALGAAALALACLALLRPLIDVGDDRAADPVAGLAAGAVALLLIVAGSIVGRYRRDERTGVFLAGCALPLTFFSAVQFVPGGFGFAHVLLGAAATCAVSILAMRLGDHGAALFTGASTGAATAALAAGTLSFTDLPTSTVGAGTVLLSLTGLAIAPRISMMQARLPLPPVPTAGAPLDEDDEENPPTTAALEGRSRRARSYLTGLVAAACCAGATGSVLAALGSGSSGIYWPGMALALCTALVLTLRGRTYAEVQHAVALVGSGSIIVLVLLGVAVFTSAQSPLTLFTAAVAVTGLAVVFGSLVPTREYSPVLRRAAELVEYATIAAVIPLACWVCGLYSAMRAL